MVRKGQGQSLGDAAARADACNKHVLLVLWACTPSIRQNANACQEALMPTGLYQDDLLAKAKLEDKVGWPDELTSSARQRSCPKQFMHSICSTKC